MIQNSDGVATVRARLPWVVTVYHDGGVRWTTAQLRLCSTFMALRKVPA